MYRPKSLLLLLTLVFTPGFRFHCFIFCSDQTNIQDEYTEVRDKCRDYASLKLDMEVKNHSGPVDDKTRKALLVSLFSECMNRSGWTVPSVDQSPDGKNEQAAAGARPSSGDAGDTDEAAAIHAATHAQKTQLAQDPEERAAILRSSECNFARYSAATSSIAAARARACDLECAERLKAAPDAPRPAACPAGSSEIMAIGRDTE